MISNSSFLGAVGSGASLALTIAVLRWLVGSKGSPLPRSRNGVNEYRIKWQWEIAGLAGGAFWIGMCAWSWHLHLRPDSLLIGMTILFVAMGAWLGTGSVTTDKNGITMKGIFSARSFQWAEISEIRLHKRDGGAVELRSGKQKIIIDTRFEASEYLLSEIENHTKIVPRKVT